MKTRYLKEFSIFLHMGRCKSLGPLKSFLSHASQLSGVSILCFFTCWVSSVLTIGSGATSRLPYCKHCSSQVPSEFRNSHLEGWNCWWLWQPCLLIWQEILHLSLTTKETTERTQATGFHPECKWAGSTSLARGRGGEERADTPTHLPGRGHWGETPLHTHPTSHRKEQWQDWKKKQGVCFQIQRERQEEA